MERCQQLFFMCIELSFLLCRYTSATAQSVGVVADMQTHLPIRGVTVRTSSTRHVVTDWQGRYKIDYQHHGATFSCVGYMARKLTTEEMLRDTVWLMPLTTKLEGVVVVAPKPDLKNAVGLRRDELSMLGRHSSMSFDFFRMFDRRVRHVSQKERERQKRILDNY